MQNVVIFHGTDESPNHFWYPWLMSNLQVRNYKVWMEQMPECDTPKIELWREFAMKNAPMDTESTLVGHSSGCPLILSLLETIDFKIKKAILIAGFHRPVGPNQSCPLILQNDYDWERIKAHCNEFYFINSVNDPWGCNDMQGKEMFDKLGGTLIIKNDGHFGSETYNQPYREFPLLLKLIED